MKGLFVRLAYFISLIVIIVALVIFFIKKAERRKVFSTLPEFSFIDVNGTWNKTTYLPELNGYVVILFNPGCEACHIEAKEISENRGDLQNYTFLFLSPDSLSKIKSFIMKYHLHVMDNVFYGQVGFDTISAKFGKSVIPWTFVYNKNKKLVKSELYVPPFDLDKILSE